jgi:hypothetical protein
MVTIEEVLKEYHPQGTCEPAPPKPPKMAKFNVYYWHRRYPTHKSLKSKARIDEKLKNGDFDYSPYAKYLNYEYWWMAEDIVKLRNGNDSYVVQKDKELDIYRDYKRRFDNLRKDFERDEADRMESLLYSLQYYFGGRKEQVHKFVYEVAEGTIEEIIKQYPKWIQHQNNLEEPF